MILLLQKTSHHIFQKHEAPKTLCHNDNNPAVIVYSNNKIIRLSAKISLKNYVNNFLMNNR